METLASFFQQLTEDQKDKFKKLKPLFLDWNEKINLISRKDTENFYPHHVLHALSIAKVFNFRPGTRILDLGTGGGFPGLPLAILFPEVNFTLIDGKAKKIKVVKDLIDQLDVKNAQAYAKRAEEEKTKYDYVVCRAVASIDKLYEWGMRLVSNKQQNAIPNGLICLKGGNVDEELKLLPKEAYGEVFPISEFIDLPYFEEKYIIYVQG